MANKFLLFLASIVLLATAVSVNPVSANENRMAGTAPRPSQNKAAFQIETVDDTRQLHHIYTSSQWPYSLQDTDIIRLEGLGLGPDTPKSKSYGTDIWLGIDRDFVTFALKQIPSFPLHPLLKHEAVKILATGGRADLLQGGNRPDPGEDLLTIRLKGLNDLMAYDDAARIYRKIKERPYHPDLLLAGITAFLGAGEYEEACLEIWSFHKFFKNTPFWQDLGEFCDQTFKDKIPSNKSGPPLTSEQFIAMPLAQSLALEKTENLHLSFKDNAQTESLLKGISLAKSRILMRTDMIEDRNIQLNLALRMYNLDLLSIEELKGLYQKAGQIEAKQASQEKDPIVELAGYYQDYIVETRDQKRLMILNKAAGLSSALDGSALHPFLDIINISLLEDLGVESQKTFLLAYMTYSEIPTWVENYVLKLTRQDGNIPSSESKPDFNNKYRFLISAALILAKIDFEDSNIIHNKNGMKKYLKYIHDITENGTQSRDTPIFGDIFIIFLHSFLDSPPNKSHSAARPYEKQMDLTSNLNYVIKSFDINQQLKNAALQRSDSQTFLLTLLLTGNKKINRLNPDIVNAISLTMIEVGMADAARIILLAASVGSYK